METNLILYSIVMYLIAIHWFTVSVYTIIGGLGYIVYERRRRPIDEVIAQKEEAKNAELCIVSIASKSVRDALFRCIEYHAEMFQGRIINVIVDEGNQLSAELPEFVKKFVNVKYVVVPKAFEPRAVAKGRAIEYFSTFVAKEENWYVFIDDDNLICDKIFLKEITYYEGTNFLMGNGILKPRRGKSPIAFVADSIRFLDDLTIFRIGTGVFGKPLNGFHGELLIVKGELLKYIGFDSKSITEDFCFATRAMKRYPLARSWQSRTIVSILSPNSIWDFIKQRNRWWRGLSSDIKTAPLPVKLFTGIRLIDWKIGVIGSWAFWPLWFFLGFPLWLVAFNSIGALYYYGTYFWGVTRLSGWRERFLGLIAIPFYSILETAGPHYYKRKSKRGEFTVINKN